MCFRIGWPIGLRTQRYYPVGEKTSTNNRSLLGLGAFYLGLSRVIGSFILIPQAS